MHFCVHLNIIINNHDLIYSISVPYINGITKKYNKFYIISQVQL